MALFAGLFKAQHASTSALFTPSNKFHRDPDLAERPSQPKPAGPPAEPAKQTAGRQVKSRKRKEPCAEEPVAPKGSVEAKCQQAQAEKAQTVVDDAAKPSKKSKLRLEAAKGQTEQVAAPAAAKPTKDRSKLKTRSSSDGQAASQSSPALPVQAATRGITAEPAEMEAEEESVPPAAKVMSLTLKYLKQRDTWHTSHTCTLQRQHTGIACVEQPMLCLTGVSKAGAQKRHGGGGAPVTYCIHWQPARNSEKARAQKSLL